MTNRTRRIYKAPRQVVLQDNVRSYRPVVVNPVAYKPKSDEQIIKLPGRKPYVVRRKNETVSADNRSTYQKQVDQKKAVQVRQKYEQQKNQQEAARGVEAMTKLISPSTYVGAAARSLTGDGGFGDNLASGKGFNDTTANIAFDLAFPFALKYGGKIGSEFLQNQMPGLFDPYTTFRGSLGYYGNSLMDRIVGTYGRRLRLPVKSRMPELFRAERDGINLENMMNLENSAEQGRFPWQNLTTDTVVRDHRGGKWSGSDVVVKNPNMYDPEAYLSTQPSDTFVLKGYNNNPFNTSNYTIVSGNTELLKKAKDAGFETLSTPNLRKAYQKIEDAMSNQDVTNNSIFNLGKGFILERSPEGKNYTSIIRKLLRKRGSATYGDYKYQSQQTGIPITVSRNPYTIPGQIKLNKSVMNPNFIFYDKSTPLESILREQLDIDISGISIKDRMLKKYDNDFLHQAAIELNKKLYERH